MIQSRSGALDLVFSLGVIEHVGTTDGAGTRRPDYHAVRARWLQEVFRIVRPGGHILLGGPNRRFPLDFSHALDAESHPLERGLSRLFGVSVHRIWGSYFLWSYGDIRRYLVGQPYRLTALRVDRFVYLQRVPRPLRPAARFYLAHLPAALLATGWNPWVMALIHKLA